MTQKINIHSGSSPPPPTSANNRRETRMSSSQEQQRQHKQRIATACSSTTTSTTTPTATKSTQNCHQLTSSDWLFISNLSKKLSLLKTTLIVGALIPLIAHGPQPSHAFSYDIWFKYPHPYTQSDPITYCPESVSASSRGSCQSAMPIYVNTLDSPKTLIPYTINQLIDFCTLSEAREFEHSHHTEWDDNIRLAPLDIKFGRNEDCKMLCKKTYKMLSHSDLYRLEELKLGLQRDYYHHWFTDTFPFSWCYENPPNAPPSTNPRDRECFIGFPIGYSTDHRGLPEDERVPIGNFTKPKTLFLFNHFDFTIMYESGDGKPWAGKLGAQAARITGLRISPRSIDHELASFQQQQGAASGSNGVAAGSAGSPSAQQQQTNGQQAAGSAAAGGKCSYAMPPLEIPSIAHYGLNLTLSLSYSYSVRFVEDEPSAVWSQRWHRLEATLPGTAKGHWILAGTILLLAACAVPALYALAKTLGSDRVLMGLNPRDESDEQPWKQLAGDIFREPVHIAIFSVLVGSGTQFIASILLSELFSAFIVLFSTTLLCIVVLLFVLVHGFVGGYAAVRLYRTFGGESWLRICILVTLLNPLVIFCLLVMSRNLLLLYNGSMMALNVGLFGSLFMAGLCFLFSLPLAYVGGSLAFRRAAIEFPVRPTANKRELTDHQLIRQPLVTTLLVGLIPFACFCAVESYPFYDSGGYIITVITILIVISLSISHCYFHLNQFDYRWWWRSYLACAIAACYYFLHCTLYMFSNLYIDTLTNALLYLSFAFFICLALFLLTGTIGFYVTFAFLWSTYAKNSGAPGMNYAMFQKNAQIE